MRFYKRGGVTAMKKNPNVQIVICKCGQRNAYYGIRAEEKEPNKWFFTWAFPISEKSMRSEKYDKNLLSGTFEESEDYPGCPYCHTYALFQCGHCGKLNCWDGLKSATCAYCGETSTISGIITHLNADGDI